MDSRRLQIHSLVKASRSARSLAVRAGGRALDWGDRAAGKLPNPSRRETWRGVRASVISAALISFIGLAASAWADHFYGKIGLTRDDAGVSLLRPVAFALIVSGVIVVTPTALLAIHLVGLRRPGRWLLALIGGVAVAGLVADQWGSALGAFAFGMVLALVVLPSLQGLRARTSRPQLVRASFNLIRGSLLVAVIWIAADARPMTYRELADGGPVSLSQLVGLGAPIPNDFAILTDQQGRRPVVTLHRNVWLTVIDPCTPPPYAKVLVRFDKVDITATTAPEALKLCPQFG